MKSTDWNTQPKDFGFSSCVGCYLSEIHTVISNSAIRCYCEFYCLGSIICSTSVQPLSNGHLGIYDM